MRRHVEVVAAVFLREAESGGGGGGGGAAEFLLARRPEGKVYAGYWEFPGGKVEAGETPRQALVREIEEELAVTIDRAWPWLSCEYDYPHALVRIRFFRVASWHGEIAPVEHSGLAWLKIGGPPTVAPILPANGPILRALRLPPMLAITNAAGNGVAAELQRLEAALAGGLRLVQVRDKTLPAADRRLFAERVTALAKPYADALILINDDEALAHQVGAHGLHLSSGRLAQLAARPALPWVAASCHSQRELALAAAHRLDFALLSPVLPTASHPGVQGMGWQKFDRLVAGSPLPVFALGGMRPEMLETAMEHGAHGIALLRGWK